MTIIAMGPESARGDCAVVISSHPGLVAIENFERSSGIDKIPERLAMSVNDSRIKQIAIPSILQFHGTPGALYY